jgi:hypothetical protein
MKHLKFFSVILGVSLKDGRISRILKGHKNIISIIVEFRALFY